ncbi:MAG: hypothetical protein ACJARY_001960 [Candidatus Azotimanducaceae bacterium]|jgi:hypothetical protein
MPGGFGFKFEVDFLNNVAVFNACFGYTTGLLKTVMG